MNSDFEKIIPGLKKLYGDNVEDFNYQMNRYTQLQNHFVEKFNKCELDYFSTPGRTEIGGNHTDHNAGIVLAGSVNLDTIAAAARNDENGITIYSEGFSNSFTVDIEDLNQNKLEEGSTTALLRGIVSRFKQLNYKVGGFNAYISSNVLVGSGLSSSASIEVLIGTILNVYFNDGKISAEEIAMIGQYAENEYFGKPCGLMDQMACSVGGIISIDFKELQNPIVTKVNFDFNTQDYSLLIVDTGGSHADLTEDYALIPTEMKSVAKCLGEKVAREITFKTIFENVKILRQQVGDRAILRVLHYFTENKRVLDQVNALGKNEFEHFLHLINSSGNSSNKWLQNSYSIKNPRDQGVNLALAISENYINEKGQGACRVHGGGFAGTIQVFLPNEFVDEYKKIIQSAIEDSSVLVLKIRSYGSLHLDSII